jgi:ParB-like chromosome segregation protein Spo0J
MPISNDYGRIPIADVVINRDSRQRREITTSDIEPSISKHGVLQPIVITRQHVLVSGERRLEASRALGLPDIPFRYLDELSRLECEILELEENIKRRDLVWQDLVKATARIHSLYVDQDADWTQTQTAEAISLSDGTVSLYLSVSRQIDDERVASCGTVREASNLLDRRLTRQRSDQIERILFPKQAAASQQTTADSPPPVAPPPESILCEDFLSWAAHYEGEKFNLIHCDFPYGRNEFAGPQMSPTAFADQGSGYSSKPTDFTELLDGLLLFLPRLLSVSGHLMFWYTAEPQAIVETQQRVLAAAPRLRWAKFPLVWLKSDNAGVASDPRRGLRHTYEICLLATAGDRQIVRTVADTYSCPTDHRLHPSTKPEPMLRHFMSALVDESTRLLDPTCGSGAALRAAESLNAQLVLGIENNLQYAESARAELRRSRLLRRVAAQ